jgi:polyhydroxybutyrate depolymerase
VHRTIASGFGVLGGVVATALAAGCAAVIGARSLRTAAPGATTFHTLSVDGRERSFLLHLPPSMPAGGRVPLLLAFHGYMGNANVEMETTRLNAVADRAGFAVAYPNGTGPLRFAGLTWNAATCCGSAERRRIDDVAFARALVDTLVRTVSVDPQRVYATGFSACGMMALLLACQRAPFIAGAADVAGAMPDTTCPGSMRVPVLLVRGDSDGELRHDHLLHRRRNNNRYAVSFAGALEFWAAHNGCARGVVRDSAADYERITARGCPPGLAVREIVVRGQAHAWPGGSKPWPFSPAPAKDVDASAIIVRFFEEEQARREAARPGAR